MAFFIPTIQPGYVYTSTTRNPKAPDTVVISQSDCDSTKFVGHATIDGLPCYAFKNGKRYYFALVISCKNSTLRMFTIDDIQPIHFQSDKTIGRLDTTDSDYIDNPTWWQLKGLSETATGYGGKLTTSRMLWFQGRLHRIYCMLYSNSGTAYILTNGKRLLVG